MDNATQKGENQVMIVCCTEYFGATEYSVTASNASGPSPPHPGLVAADKSQFSGFDRARLDLPQHPNSKLDFFRSNAEAVGTDPFTDHGDPVPPIACPLFAFPNNTQAQRGKGSCRKLE